MFLMPWGKHKGELIENIPTAYLEWLLENTEDHTIIEEAEQELDFRNKWH